MNLREELTAICNRHPETRRWLRPRIAGLKPKPSPYWDSTAQRIIQQPGRILRRLNEKRRSWLENNTPYRWEKISPLENNTWLVQNRKVRRQITLPPEWWDNRVLKLRSEAGAKKGIITHLTLIHNSSQGKIYVVRYLDETLAIREKLATQLIDSEYVVLCRASQLAGAKQALKRRFIRDFNERSKDVLS